MALKNFLPGVKTKIFWGNLTQFELAAASLSGLLLPPANQTITLSAAVTVSAVTLAVTALTAPVAAGTPLKFVSGGNSFVVETSTDVPLGATSIPIIASQTAIPTAAVCAHLGLILLKGGTNSQEQIQNTSQDIQVYGDSATGPAFKDGIITDAMWSVSYDFKVLPDDLGYRRLKYTVIHASAGARGYILKVDPAPPGYATGESIGGLADIADWSIDNPSDNIISGKCSFKGRGTPVTLSASLVAPVV